MGYQLPAPPATGMVTDSRNLGWRRNASDLWEPDACPTCGSCLTPLTWAALLEQRGPLTEVV